jgi:tetratricopeptide (TPR) repeat protein
MTRATDRVFKRRNRRKTVMKRTDLLVTALSMLIAASAPRDAPAQTYIEPFLVEDGIFLYRQAVRAAHRDLSAEAADFSRSSIEALQSCVPIATEKEKAEIYYFVGRNHVVLGDLDEAEMWFKKAAEIDFIAPEAYGALLKIVDMRGPRGPEHREALIEARKPIYEAARRVCPYNTSLLFPVLGGFLNPRSESAEASMNATGKIPQWIAKEQPVHFRVPPVVSSSFVQMRMWDEAIRAYQLQRQTQLEFEGNKRALEYMQYCGTGCVKAAPRSKRPLTLEHT